MIETRQGALPGKIERFEAHRESLWLHWFCARDPKVRRSQIRQSGLHQHRAASGAAILIAYAQVDALSIGKRTVCFTIDPLRSAFELTLRLLGVSPSGLVGRTASGVVLLVAHLTDDGILRRLAWIGWGEPFIAVCDHAESPEIVVGDFGTPPQAEFVDVRVDHFAARSAAEFALLAIGSLRTVSVRYVVRRGGGSSESDDGTALVCIWLSLSRPRNDLGTPDRAASNPDQYSDHCNSHCSGWYTNSSATDWCSITTVAVDHDDPANPAASTSAG
jgi:hypothetical protein